MRSTITTAPARDRHPFPGDDRTGGVQGSRSAAGWSEIVQEARSVLVKGYPFNVIYVVEEGALLVVAIAPHRKRPLYWSARTG